MRKIIMWNLVTLDGCFEGKEPWDLAFHQLVFNNELEAFSIKQLNEASMLIFGKNTYLGMADYWPKATKTDPEVAELMNSIPKVVCSSDLDKADWNNTTIIRDAVRELKELKLQGDKPMYIFGSAILSESLLNAGLLDEIRLCVVPILLGEGRRLFSDKAKTHSLKLIEDKKLSTNDGVILRYSVQNTN